MASTPLVTERIESGECVLKLLNAANFNINGALRWYSPEVEPWMLYIASTDLVKLGRIGSYRKLYDVLTKSPEDSIPLKESSISFIEPKHPLLTTLRDYFNTRQEQTVKGARISQSVINGYAVENAYV